MSWLGHHELSQSCVSQDILRVNGGKGRTTLHCLPFTYQPSPANTRRPSSIAIWEGKTSQGKQPNTSHKVSWGRCLICTCTGRELRAGVPSSAILALPVSGGFAVPKYKPSWSRSRSTEFTDSKVTRDYSVLYTILILVSGLSPATPISRQTKSRWEDVAFRKDMLSQKYWRDDCSPKLITTSEESFRPAPVQTCEWKGGFIVQQTGGNYRLSQ